MKIICTNFFSKQPHSIPTWLAFSLSFFSAYSLTNNNDNTIIQIFKNFDALRDETLALVATRVDDGKLSPLTFKHTVIKFNASIYSSDRFTNCSRSTYFFLSLSTFDDACTASGIIEPDRFVSFLGPCLHGYCIHVNLTLPPGETLLSTYPKYKRGGTFVCLGNIYLSMHYIHHLLAN